MTKLWKLVVAVAVGFIGLGAIGQQQAAKPTPKTQADAMRFLMEYRCLFP
jgi:hypothetical protein